MSAARDFSLARLTELRTRGEVASPPWIDGVERLLRALDDSPIGTALVDLDGRFLHASPSLLRIVGYAREELFELTIDAIVHPADTDPDRGPSTTARTRRFVRKDGATVFVRWSESIVRDDAGLPTCRIVQAEDVTDCLRGYEALRRSEADLRRLFEQASDAIFIVDVEGRITDTNLAGTAIFGYSREEIIGKSLMDFTPTEDLPRLADYRSQLLDLEHVHVGEWRHRRKDGVFISVETSSKFLPDGRQVGFVRDITARKRAEREREESLRWMRAVLEQAPVGLILVHGPEGERVEANARLEEMIGAPLERLDQCALRAMDGSPLDPKSCPTALALRGERTVGVEMLLRHVNGSTTPVVTSSAPILGVDGSVVGAVLAILDITAAKELERLRAEWSSVVAHDLRQPLSAIAVNAQIVDRKIGDPKLARHVEHIASAAKRLNRMVDDIMDLSRLEARRLELLRQPVDMNALVRVSVERLSLEVPDRAVDVHIDGEPGDADADPDRVAQVLENLLTNAVKYGDAAAPILIHVERDGDEIAVTVTNEGKPLAPEEIARLFERFQRASSGKVQGINGTGLGLYITRSLVEAHGGRITAESTPEGRTAFRFTLPAAR